MARTGDDLKAQVLDHEITVFINIFGSSGGM